MARYQVSPIADANCDRITSATLLATDDLQAALEHARHHTGAFGAGILDTKTGKLDVGFGFGMPCPDVEG